MAQVACGALPHLQRGAAQVGPFANPNEVYAFYSLPYCAPTEIETKRENLGALLKGDRPTKTRYDLKFKSAPRRLCTASAPPLCTASLHRLCTAAAPPLHLCRRHARRAGDPRHGLGQVPFLPGGAVPPVPQRLSGESQGMGQGSAKPGAGAGAVSKYSSFLIGSG